MNTKEKLKLLQANIEKVIIGKPEAVRLTIITLLARGHLLIEDIPGVGKTTLAQSLARSLDVAFQRIQFTSDLLPSDILGVSVFNQKNSQFEFMPGPIFTPIILADEINRTTPRTQSALLEAMNEGQVTIEGTTHKLPRPFMVMATQNPVEHYGTYPLPDSQLDRFLMSMDIGYPDAEKERDILKSRSYGMSLDGVGPVLSREDVIGIQDVVESVKVEDSLLDYIIRIIQATRNSPALRLGVSTRGALALKQAAKAKALLLGRDYTIPDDIKEMARPVLAHRVILGPQDYESEKRIEIAGQHIEDIVSQVKVPV